jgi:hypothetical protein
MLTFSDTYFSIIAGTTHNKDELQSKKKAADNNGMALLCMKSL